MPDNPSRRRVLRILAAGAAIGFAPASQARPVEWRGAALGADVSILFSDADAKAANAVVESILAEIERLESIFSLQRGDSEISRLNSVGRLAAPSADLIEVLSISRAAHAVTLGKFDPSVQGLWRFHVDWYAQDRGRRRPDATAFASTLAAVGFDRVRFSPSAVELTPGAGLTLNGIAQGYITDRACALLRAAGFRHVLVDLGETRALDARSDGQGWRIALPDQTGIALPGGALATSAGAATRLADNGDHHIFDPATGRPATHWDWLAVAHPQAAFADALSTGLYCLAPDLALDAANAIRGARLWGRSAAGVAIAS